MDVFAHLASGALLGRACLPEGSRWKSFVGFGALTAVSPDVDVVVAAFGHEAWSQFHQVFTHSLLGVLWVPLLVSVLPFSFAPWRTRLAMAAGGWSLHVVLDVCANWPVPLLWPVSTERFALHLLASDFSWIIDMMLIVGLAVTLWDPAKKHARSVVAGLAVLVTAWLAAGLPT